MSLLTARAIGVCATLAAAFVVWRIADLLAVVLGAIAVASAIEPLIRNLRGRWLGRGLAIALAYLLVTAVVVVSVGLALRAVTVDLPTLMRDLGRDYQRHRDALRHGRLFTRHLAAGLPTPDVLASVATPSLTAVATALRATFSFAWLLLLALFWSYGGRPFEARCLALFPVQRRARIAAAWNGTFDAIGGALATLATSLITSLVPLFLLFHLLGVPYGGVIAVLVAGIRLLPFVGGAAAVALAFACGALAGPGQAVVAAVVTCALLIASRHVLPRDQASSPPAFLLALCTFALVQLSGFVAALLGPVVAAAIAALLDVAHAASARRSQA